MLRKLTNFKSYLLETIALWYEHLSVILCCKLHVVIVNQMTSSLASDVKIYLTG